MTYLFPVCDLFQFSEEEDALSLGSSHWFHDPYRPWVSFELINKHVIFRLKLRTDLSYID